MRIGVEGVTFTVEFTGVPRYLKSMLEEMVQIAPDDEFIIYAPLPIDLCLPGNNWRIRVVPHFLSKRPTLWTQFVLPGVLAADNVDVFWGQPTNLPLSLKHRCLRVLTLHDLVPYIEPDTMQLRALIRTRLLLRKVAQAADIVVCVSGATANLAQEYLGFKDNKIRVIGEAASPAFKPLPKDRARKIVREKFGIEGDYLIFVSTIEPRKEHRTLFQAIRLIPDAPLLVLVGGRGWRSRGIFKEMARLEEEGRVRYLGRVGDEDLCALYSAARLSVYPSRYEGFGLPVLEAMACSCPVLCSDSSSLPEVGGEAAAYFRTGDARDLARQLQRLLANNELLDEMARKGIERAREFSFKKAAGELIEVIRARLR